MPPDPQPTRAASERNRHVRRVPKAPTQLDQTLEQQGWQQGDAGRRCHHKLKAPGGGVVIMPNLPSDHRAWQNMPSLLRRYGADLPR